MSVPLFPIWQVDEREYQAICAYLGLPPQPHLHTRLNEYLKHAPFTCRRPQGFARFLATARLSTFRVARLDLASKLLFPEHPIRHILNTVIALHECDGPSYRQMAAAPKGWAVWPAVFGWAAGSLLSALATLGWLGAQFLLYLSVDPSRRMPDLAGKRILITGVNRGLGWDLLGQALQQGAAVVGTVRNPEALGRLRTMLPPEAQATLVLADLAEPGACVSALEAAGISPDSLDMAVLCAGAKHAGASLMALSDLRETFQVNLFSAIEVADWLYRTGHTATLVLVSSMGRWHGMHSSGGYNASKAALSIWGESLEMELSLGGNPRGHVLIVEPGMFASGMVKAKGVQRFLLSSSRELATRILSAASEGRTTLRYPLWFALLTWTVCLGGRRLRRRLFARTVS